ncbi:MAG: hypothetical protein LUG83_10610, partial [Lachnospiraceae bacterium]|nr:hypothetical protein [Lachnospiraceae bacterium]
EYAAKREEYGRLNSEYNARRAVFTKEAEYFKKGIPDREEADLCIESNIALAAARSEALKYTLSEAESSALNAGRLRFSRGIPQSGEINTAYDLLESYDNIERGRGRSRRTAALILLCAVAAAAGMALAVFNKPAGIIFAAIGAALFILGVAALFIQRKNRHKSADELSSGLKNFLGRYYSAGEIGAASFEVCIRRLAESAGEYTLLCDKEESYLQACARAERLAGEIDGFLTKYGFEGSADILLPDIREHLQRYFPAKEEYERSRRRKADFENENDMEKIMSLQKPGEEGMESLNSRALKVREELESTHKNILDYDKQLDALMERAEELEELEAEVKELDERYKADKRKYELINKTKEFMEKAKLSFAAKYAAPVRKGFDRYYSMISGAAPGEYYIDADSNVTVYEAGMQRDSRFLSRGLRDLTGICMRMSLIEAMYKEEKPFIIFDEPFVNFDAAKIDGGLKLLSEIASEYQIIYFTCHPGRTKRNGGTD